MNKHSDNDIAKFIANVKCGLCGQHPGVCNINVVGSPVDSLLFITYCPPCSNPGIAVFNIIGDKETETANDLTEANKATFLNPLAPPIYEVCVTY